MRAIWTLALNDLRLTARDRPAFVWMVLMPIAMMWLFGGQGGSGSSSDPPQIALDVVDHDGGWLATALVEELEDEQLRMRQLTPDERAEVADPVRTLVLPEGFTERALAGEQQVLRLESEPDSSAGFGLAAQVHVARAIVRTLGRLVELGPSGATLEEFRGLGDRPSLVELSVSTAGRGRPIPAGTAQSVPGMLTFIVMMMTLIYGGVFLTLEKTTGMLLRQAVAPMSRNAIFLGKLLGRTLIAAVQVALLVLAGRFLFGVSWGTSPAGLLLMLSGFTVAVAALSTLLGAVLRTPAQASSVGWILSMVMAGLGGCWWPAEVMPGWLQTVSHVFPPAWAIGGFHSLISFGHGLPEVLLPAAVLFGFAALFSLLGARLLRFETSS